MSYYGGRDGADVTQPQAAMVAAKLEALEEQLHAYALQTTPRLRMRMLSLVLGELRLTTVQGATRRMSSVSVGAPHQRTADASRLVPIEQAFMLRLNGVGAVLLPPTDPAMQLACFDAHDANAPLSAVAWRSQSTAPPGAVMYPPTVPSA